MNSIKSALSEALLHRKKSSNHSNIEDDQNKKQDLAPSIKDGPGPQKVEIQIGLKEPLDGHMVDPNEPQEASLSTLMGKNPDPMEIDQLKNAHGKPRSLMEAAQRALASKKG